MRLNLRLKLITGIVTLLLKVARVIQKLHIVLTQLLNLNWSFHEIYFRMNDLVVFSNLLESHQKIKTLSQPYLDEVLKIVTKYFYIIFKGERCTNFL